MAFSSYKNESREDLLRYIYALECLLSSITLDESTVLQKIIVEDPYLLSMEQKMKLFKYLPEDIRKVKMLNKKAQNSKED